MSNNEMWNNQETQLKKQYYNKGEKNPPIKLNIYVCCRLKFSKNPFSLDIHI